MISGEDHSPLAVVLGGFFTSSVRANRVVEESNAGQNTKRDISGLKHTWSRFAPSGWEFLLLRRCLWSPFGNSSGYMKKRGERRRSAATEDRTRWC
jgi:hypothetical protein